MAEPAGVALGSEDEVLRAGAPLASDMGGRVVRDMRYWKPWQPPLSTVMRRARFGLESLAMISLRRCFCH